MSEGAPNMGDEPPVLGEPASQPHQAAVVGEPPEEVVPVLGEPVPLANGLQKGQQPDSSPSPDKSTVNGVQKESSESPSQSRHAPPPTGSTEESPNPAEEHITSEEASAEEGATENPTLSESSMDASDARAQEIPDSTHGTNEANPDADTSADVEVTHLADVPSEPPLPESEISTENPFSVLDEGSEEVANEGEEPSDVPSEIGEEAAAAAPPVEDEDSTKGLGAEGDATASPIAHEETPKDLGASTADSQGKASEESSIEVEDKNVNKEMSEDVKAFEPTKADATTKGSNVGGSSAEEAAAEATGSVDDSVSTGEKAQVGETTEENSAESGSTLGKVGQAKSGEEVKPVSAKQDEDVDASAVAPPGEAGRMVRREALILPDISCNDKVSSKEGEEQASSLVQIDKDVSGEAFPKESSGLRAIAMEAGTDDQASSDDPSLGENGFQHGQDGIPVEKEQVLAKGDLESAEAKEKPSSRFKLPLIFTTLAVAVVGVAVASISRSRH